MVPYIYIVQLSLTNVYICQSLCVGGFSLYNANILGEVWNLKVGSI